MAAVERINARADTLCALRAAACCFCCLPPPQRAALSFAHRLLAPQPPYTHNTQGPVSSLGIYVNCGSIYESPATSGASALLESLAFKATAHRDAPRVMQEVELIGANVLAQASREQMSYTVDFLGTHAPAALELLADCVLNPALEAREVEEQQARLAALLASPDVQPLQLTERLVCGAYEGALSKPLIPDADGLAALTPARLAGFVREQFLGPRVVLAGAGVDHKRLVELAAPMLGALPAGSGGSGAHSSSSTSSSSTSSTSSSSSMSTSSSSNSGSSSAAAAADDEPPSRYVGCHALLPGAAPQTSLILAFESRGGWRDVQASVVMTVLTYLLGGGSSFSSGGPGKGMHSRLYTRVLNQYHWVHACSSFTNTFNGTGLVGVQASADHAKAGVMLDVMCRELEALASPPPGDQLERAKRMAVSLIHSVLESKSASAEDIGRQFLTYGHRISGAEYVRMIEAVSPADVAGFVRSLLASRPSLAALGDGAEGASYERLLARYGPGGEGAGAAGRGGGGAGAAAGGGGGSGGSGLLGGLFGSGGAVAAAFGGRGR